MPSPSFYTAAGNFVDVISGGVDPRTGLFNVSLPLMSLRTGDLAGPGLALALRYSPLAPDDQGFGRGFSLNLTRYDIAGRRLHLSTGEEYRISNSGNTVLQHRFRNFTFEHTDAITFRVTHKSGLVETLVSFGSVAYTTEISDPVGRVLHLEWSRSKTLARLTQVFEIKNGKRNVLCNATYPDANTATTTFTLLPADAGAGYEVIFNFDKGVLKSVVSHADTPEHIWTFTYDKLNPFITKWQPGFLTGITFPTGLRESVVYPSTYGMNFPDGVGLAPLPCVTRHDVAPGGGQPVVTTLWEWTEENHLGRNALGMDFTRWQPDTDLMLEILSSGYVYGSTAKTLDAAGRRVVCSVTRRYNNFHQQLSESTLRDGKTYTVSTEYYARTGATMAEQPTQYLLPKRKTEIWKDSSGARMRITRWQFDGAGNLIREWAPDGTRTKFVYYHAQGETDCPADPHGFTRYLKRKKVTPRSIRGDEVATITKHYWKKLDNLSGEGYAVVPAGVTETTGTVRTRVVRQYYTDKNNALTYGREKQRTATLTPGVESQPDVSYTRTEDFAYESRNEGLFQSVTLTSHDNLTLTRSTLRHAVLGLLLSETDAQGVRVTFTYDKSGRVLSRTVAPGRPFEQKTSWACAIENGVPVTTETDAAGNQLRTWFDGAGREIKRERLDIDSTNGWFEVSSQNYGVQGEVTASSASDWLTTAPAEQYVVRTGFTYDGWGSLRDTSSSDGVLVRQTRDPVKLTQTVFARGSSADGQNSDTATRLTELYRRCHLPRRETITVSGVAAERRFEWNGTGQLRQVTDENGQKTQYTYDVLGRVLTQTLPDGTVVSRTYAPHLTGDQVASISVTGKDADGQIKTWQPGTQTFDGFGRLTERVSGGRTTSYTYNGASPVPAGVTLPSGKKITYAYIPELGNVPQTVTADGLTQKYFYNPATGALLGATEGGCEDNNTLTPSGSLKKESFTRGGTTREASYTRTLAGAVDTYTDVAGKETNYVRDASGRLTQAEDEALTVSLKYDPLGRLSQRRVTDRATKATQTTSLAYDDAGREILRTITDGGATRTLTVSQTWTLNSLMPERITQWGGTTVRKESYTYDDRNRLTGYKALGTSLPQDAYGKKIKAQTYQYDALNNLTTVATTLADDGLDTATYHYGNSDDPTQLTSVTHTHDSYPQTVTLEYDAEGRMTQDEAGRTLTYDIPGRLISVSGNGADGGYGYDALNRLVSQRVSATDTRQLYYRGGERVNEIRVPEEKSVRLIKTGAACVGVSEDSRLTLTAGDHHGSLLWSLDTSQQDAELHSWAPYGSGKATAGLPGFNGEPADSVNGTYHLGNGYRPYNPVLMRFTCPDSLSPFGGGGINPYAYCAGDPVNFTDPSGHLGMPDYFGGMMMAGMTIIGLAAALLSGGLAIAAAGGVMAAIGAASTTALVAGGLGVTADVTALASIAVEDSSPEASAVLGWVSMATGLAGMGVGVRGALRSRSGAGSEVLRLRGGGAPEDEQFLMAKAFSLIQHADEAGAEKRIISDVGYVNNFAETGEPLLILHGASDSATVYNVTVGVYRNAPGAESPFTLSQGTAVFERYALKNLVELLHERHGVDLYSLNKPLHFISCLAGGDDGQAQMLAEILKIPVRGYGNKVLISIGIPGNGLSDFWYKGAQSRIRNSKTGAILLPATYYPLYR